MLGNNMKFLLSMVLSKCTCITEHLCVHFYMELSSVRYNITSICLYIGISSLACSVVPAVVQVVVVAYQTGKDPPLSHLLNPTITIQ